MNIHLCRYCTNFNLKNNDISYVRTYYLRIFTLYVGNFVYFTWCVYIFIIIDRQTRPILVCGARPFR